MLEANAEAPLLDAEVGREGQLHHVPRRVQGHPAGRQTTKPGFCVTGVHHNPVILAARRLLQLEVHEVQLDDEAGRGLHGPLTAQGVGVFLGVAGRRELPLGLR